MLRIYAFKLLQYSNLKIAALPLYLALTGFLTD